MCTVLCSAFVFPIQWYPMLSVFILLSDSCNMYCICAVFAYVFVLMALPFLFRHNRFRRVFLFIVIFYTTVFNLPLVSFRRRFRYLAIFIMPPFFTSIIIHRNFRFLAVLIWLSFFTPLFSIHHCFFHFHFTFDVFDTLSFFILLN